MSWITDCALFEGIVEIPGAAQLPGAILSFSPTSYFQLRETSGTNADDLGSLANDGTYGANANLAVRAGPTGDGGYAYPDSTAGGGLSEGVSIPDNNAYTPSAVGGLTVGCLVYFDAITTDHCIVAKFGSGVSAREWRWEIVSDGRMFVETNTAAGGTARRRITATGFATTGAWHLGIVRFDSSLTAFPTLRYDGANITGTTSGSGTAQGNTAAVVTAMVRGSAAPMNGSVAHVFTISGMLSDANCGVIEAAAQADGWI